MPAPGRGTTTEESAELKRLKRENAELQAGQRDLEDGVGFLRGRTRPATALIVRVHRASIKAIASAGGLRWGVESICAG